MKQSSREWLVWVILGVGMLTETAGAGVYNLRLITDNVPDYTDIESFVQSVTGHLETPQDKCIAVWRWGRRSRRQTSCSTEDGRLIWDPILHYNSYGTMNCGVISGLNITSWLQLGYQGRYIQLGDHTVSEVSWDGGKNWHLFDSSMSFFCYDDTGVVASCEQIKSAHSGPFTNGRAEPGYYYFYHGARQCITHRGPDGWRVCSDNPVDYDRTLANGAESYTTGYSVDKYTLHARWGHRYILNLKPGQVYTRYWRPLGSADGPWTGGMDDRDYYRPLVGKDPDEHHNLHNIRSNGVWVFRPRLDASDARDMFYDTQGIDLDEDNGVRMIHPAKPRQPGWVTFKISAANVITSMRITGRIKRTAPDDIVRILVSRFAGNDWTEVWKSDPSGTGPIDLSLRDAVAGTTECLVKIEMTTRNDPTDTAVDGLEFRTITQLNRRTLPSLTLGTNHLRLSAGRQVETAVLWPPLQGDSYKTTVLRARNIRTDEKADGMYKATLGASLNNTLCEAIWRVRTPTDILGARLAAIVTNRSPNSSSILSYSLDGEKFTEFYRKSDGDAPFDKQVLQDLDGDELAGAREICFKAAFLSRNDGGTYSMPGIQDLLMQIEHRPADAEFVPVEITYNWTEHRKEGDVTRSHTELVTSLPHNYTINTGGYRDPTMNWVRMNLKDGNPEKNEVVYGYSDGLDVGPGFEPKPVIYAWGRNLAEGKPYTVSRSASGDSQNPDTDGCELTNGKIIAATQSTQSPKIQAATAFWETGELLTATIDLGDVQTMEAARITTHQPNERYCHPARMEVSVSTDGKIWTDAGTIEHNDLWLPPGDYEPWEHDDSPQYANLPAGGRLAYSYPLAFAKPLTGRYVRVICIPLDNRGMGLSEMEIFDNVEVKQAPPVVAPLGN